MEEFLKQGTNDSVFDLSPPQVDDEQKVWSLEDDKQFEKAIAELDHSSPIFFENIASRIPSKSLEDVKIHYQALVEDVDMIEAGLIEPPQYKDQRTTGNGQGSSSSRDITRRGVPWTEEEHRLFLKGLEKYGKGDWRSISRYCVLTRTPTQVASHAQKYFRRLQSSIPAERRRPSIHDIQVTTDTTITSTGTTSSTTTSAIPTTTSKN